MSVWYCIQSLILLIILALQGSSDPGVLEVNQEVLPIPPVSKMAKVEGCIQMYEEIYRMKGRVNKNKSMTDPKPCLGHWCRTASRGPRCCLWTALFVFPSGEFGCYTVVLLAPVHPAGEAPAAAGAAGADGEGSIWHGKRTAETVWWNEGAEAASGDPRIARSDGEEVRLVLVSLRRYNV